MDTPNALCFLRPIAGLCALLGLATPSVAVATEAVVPPLIGNGVDPLIVLNMTSLLSSEMDFMSEFDGVTQLENRPAAFTSKCLGSAGCLAGVAREGGGDSLLGGAVSTRGNKFDLYLVYVKDGRIVRAKEFQVPNVPSVIADSMGGYVRELVTGVAPAAAAAAASGTVDEEFFEDEEEDFAMGAAVVAGGGAANSRRINTPQGTGSNELDGFDFDADPEADARKAQEAAAAERRAEEERRAAALAAQREQEAAERRQRAEEERRRREAEEERRREEEAAAAAAALAAAQRAEEEEEEEELSFGSADITFAPVPMQLDEEPPPAESSSDFDFDADPDPEPQYGSEDGYAGLDEEAPKRRQPAERAPRASKERSSRDTSSRTLDRRASSSRSNAPAAVAAARLGYANFQGLGFVTYGAEVSFLATDSLAILAGVEAYSTRRDVPQDLVDRGAPPEVWNTILPFNLGLAYRFLDGDIQPYAGGDVVLIPGYVKETAGLATGLRVRGGSDFMVSDTFGFNVNVSLGVWAGQNFEEVETAASTAAFTPQLSVGTVFHF